MVRGALLAFLALIASIPMAAQPRPLGPSLFPSPTGRNGYEELIAARDLLARSASLDTATAPEATLTVRREAIRRPEVVRALALVRAGLAKELRSPLGSTAISDELRSQALSAMRVLGRLLGVEAYVLLADGRTDRAVSNLRDRMRIGYLCQRDTLLGGMVGVALNRAAVTLVAEHLEEFCARDCDQLLALAQEWLRSEDPAIQAIASERALLAARLSALLAPLGVPHKDEVSRLLGDQFDAHAAVLRQPAWQRKPAPAFTGTGPAYDLAVGLWKPIEAPVALAIERWTDELAMVQLLGVHAAIRRYRWEHNQLPPTLELLTLGQLAVDPYSGKPFGYERTKDGGYELWSIGPVDRGIGAAAPTGGRKRIDLPPRPPGGVTGSR